MDSNSRPEDDQGSRPPAPGQDGGYLDTGEEWQGTPTPASEQRHEVAVPADGAPPWDPPPPPGLRSESTDVPPVVEVRRGRARIRGVARNVQSRTDTGPNGSSSTVLSFRVDRYDDRGNRLAAAGVGFPGYRGGQLGDGEQVEVSGSWHHGTLRADEVTNLATGSSLLGIPGWVRKLGIVVAGLVVLGAAVFVVSLLVHRGSAGVVTVPDVVGLPVNVASSNLSDAGLSPEGALEPNPTVPFGDVIRTSPAAGSSVATHTTVIVYSSTGPPH